MRYLRAFSYSKTFTANYSSIFPIGTLSLMNVNESDQLIAISRSHADLALDFSRTDAPNHSHITW